MVAILIGPSEVSTVMAIVSPLNWWFTKQCLMLGFTNIATPEYCVSVLCMYTVYGCSLIGAVFACMFVCANSMMSGLSCVKYCVSAGFLSSFQPLIFWKAIFRWCGWRLLAGKFKMNLCITIQLRCFHYEMYSWGVKNMVFLFGVLVGGKFSFAFIAEFH